MPIISHVMDSVAIKWCQYWKLVSIAHGGLVTKCFGPFQPATIQVSYKDMGLLEFIVRGTIPGGNHLPIGHKSPSVESSHKPQIFFPSTVSFSLGPFPKTGLILNVFPLNKFCNTELQECSESIFSRGPLASVKICWPYPEPHTGKRNWWFSLSVWQKTVSLCSSSMSYHYDQENIYK